nr:capsid protein parvo [Cressdnaviricota sp.]
MSNWHGHYFGPGNRIDEGFRRAHRPVDSLDAAAEKHDLAYNQLQKKYGKLLPYVLPSDADKKFLKDIEHEKGFKASAARLFFKAKQLAPVNLTMPVRYNSGGLAHKKTGRRRFENKKQDDAYRRHQAVLRASANAMAEYKAAARNFLLQERRAMRIPRIDQSQYQRRRRVGGFSLPVQDTTHGSFAFYRPVRFKYGFSRR